MITYVILIEVRSLKIRITTKQENISTRVKEMEKGKIPFDTDNTPSMNEISIR